MRLGRQREGGVPTARPTQRSASPRSLKTREGAGNDVPSAVAGCWRAWTLGTELSTASRSAQPGPAVNEETLRNKTVAGWKKRGDESWWRGGKASSPSVLRATTAAGQWATTAGGPAGASTLSSSPRPGWVRPPPATLQTPGGGCRPRVGPAGPPSPLPAAGGERRARVRRPRYLLRAEIPAQVAGSGHGAAGARPTAHPCPGGAGGGGGGFARPGLPGPGWGGSRQAGPAERESGS